MPDSSEIVRILDSLKKNVSKLNDVAYGDGGSEELRTLVTGFTQNLADLNNYIAGLAPG